MLKMKKILSVALVVVMLFGVFALNTSALETGKAFGYILKSDKTEKEIVPGAIITVSLSYEMADFNQKMSDIKPYILYDKNVYTPILDSREFVGNLAGYAKDATMPFVDETIVTEIMDASSMTNEEKALYNSSVCQQVMADVGKKVTNKMGYTVTEDADGVSVVQMTLKFKVTGDEAALSKGNKNIKIADVCIKTSQWAKYTDGVKTPKFFKNSDFDASRANIMANMPSTPSYSVAKYKTQVKFTGDKTTAPDDLFQFRLTSVITAADFAAMNSNGNTIKSVGFIAANTGAADAADAKAAVEKGTALPSAWKAASTDYVSQANASSDAYFGAIVKNISHASQATDIDCIAYVCYNDGTADHYVWYSAAVTAKVASGYDAAVAAWKAQ